MISQEYNKIATHIEKNAQDEHEALQGYLELLIELKEHGGDSRDIAVIEEIMSDEIQHASILKKLFYKYTKIKEAGD